jgi:hypothetical protein
MKNSKDYLNSVENNLKRYYNSKKLTENGDNELPPLNGYFLSLEDELYYRAKILMITYGGPNVFIRFFKAGKIELIYSDGTETETRDITQKKWAVWIKEYFNIYQD